jgi:hypothetical protein
MKIYARLNAWGDEYKEVKVLSIEKHFWALDKYLIQYELTETICDGLGVPTKEKRQRTVTRVVTEDQIFKV